LSTAGGKTELADRIAHYLDTREKLPPISRPKKTKNPGIITIDSIIGNDFVCSEKHRSFFKQVIGNSFCFNVLFQKWLKKNPEKTYRDAIQAYYQILEDKKRSKTTIDKQFEYNTYIRDFFANNVEKCRNSLQRFILRFDVVHKEWN
jgi:hypothetical protein